MHTERMVVGKHVLVTGATRGIGIGIARKLLDSGYSLTLMGSTDASFQNDSSKPLVDDERVTLVSVDLSNLDAINEFVASWDAPLWGIVNNAGICKTLPLLSNEDDPYEEVVTVNMRAPYYLTKGLVKHLTNPGRIVNIASQLGLEGRADYSAYCASKFALIGMTKCWAKELGSKGVTVNAVCPGWVDTEMSQIDMSRMAKEHGVSVEKYYEEICSPLELKRFNSTEEVAELVAFLLSSEASGITGRDWLMQTIWNQV
jgi:NAD(P)-dependent dehydrogenase (short-subunit alcohol dehydrogenase family)